MLSCLRVMLTTGSTDFGRSVTSTHSRAGITFDSVHRCTGGVKPTIKTTVNTTSITAATLIIRRITLTGRLRGATGITGSSVGRVRGCAINTGGVNVRRSTLNTVFRSASSGVNSFLSANNNNVTSFFRGVTPGVNIATRRFHGLSKPRTLRLCCSDLRGTGVNRGRVAFCVRTVTDSTAALVPLLTGNNRKFSI